MKNQAFINYICYASVLNFSVCKVLLYVYICNEKISLIALIWLFFVFPPKKRIYLSLFSIRMKFVIISSFSLFKYLFQPCWDVQKKPSRGGGGGQCFRTRHWQTSSALSFIITDGLTTGRKNNKAFHTRCRIELLRCCKKIYILFTVHVLLKFLAYRDSSFDILLPVL